MISYIKKFLLLMILSLILVSCGGDDSQTSTKSCNSNSDCNKTQECRFSSKTDNSGECVEKKICQDDKDCSDKRACAASLIGTEKYCGGFLTNFNFKDNQTLKQGTVNEEYNETVELMGQTGAFHIVLKNGDKLPDGLMINLNTGDISGTPTKEGEFKFTLIAYNGASDAKYYYNIIKVEKEFTIKINKANVCTPKTCADLSAQCGSIDDGCGNTLDCGTCSDGQSCSNNQCIDNCTPKTCDDLSAQCGSIDDGCGNTLDCGTCSDGQSCSNNQCGSIDDGCGNTLDCGTCSEGQSCSNNQCIDNCTPKTCDDLSAQCGSINDGCGNTLDCGTCSDGQSCSNNQCVDNCTPKTCDDLSAQCGSIDDGCGNTLDCGTCAAGSECVNNLCETICTPKTCDDLSAQCGSIDDGCGNTLDCGGCRTGSECVNNLCEVSCIPDCDGKTCGDDGCGDICGICGARDTCNYDGAVCETSSIAGDIVITEFMPNPATVSDTNGEWIELYNTTDNVIDITNLKIIKDTTEKSITPSGASRTLEIQPHSYFVIARKDATTAKLPVVDAECSFSLSNTGTHVLSIKLNDELLDSIHYTGNSNGKSWQVDPSLKDHDLNDYSIAWCKGSTAISRDNADLGTPGNENIACPE